MSKLHSYYVTNAASELKHVFHEIPENQIENQIEDIIRKIQYGGNEELDELEEINEDEEINEINETDNLNNNNLTDYNSYFNFSDTDFRKAMEIDVSVVVEQPEPMIFHGNTDFNNEELLNSLLNI